MEWNCRWGNEQPTFENVGFTLGTLACGCRAIFDWPEQSGHPRKRPEEPVTSWGIKDTSIPAEALLGRLRKPFGLCRIRRHTCRGFSKVHFTRTFTKCGYRSIHPPFENGSTRREYTPEGARCTTHNQIDYAAPSGSVPTGAVEFPIQRSIAGILLYPADKLNF